MWWSRFRTPDASIIKSVLSYTHSLTSHEASAMKLASFKSNADRMQCNVIPSARPFHPQCASSCLCDPEPHSLEEVPRLSLWPDLGVERGLASPDVGLAGLDERRALHELPSKVEEEVDRDDDVSAISLSAFNSLIVLTEATYAVTKSWMAQFDSPVTESCVKTFQPLKMMMMMK